MFYYSADNSNSNHASTNNNSASSLLSLLVQQPSGNATPSCCHPIGRQQLVPTARQLLLIISNATLYLRRIANSTALSCPSGVGRIAYSYSVGLECGIGRWAREMGCDPVMGINYFESNSTTTSFATTLKQLTTFQLQLKLSYKFTFCFIVIF